MRVTVDTDTCIGAGECALTCPEVFGQDDQGYVVLLDPNPDESLRPQIEDAVARCPSGAIAAAD
jgi:ferredoxin